MSLLPLWSVLGIFLVVLIIGLTREWILWNRDRRQETENIGKIADAWIQSLRKDHDTD